MNPRCPGSGGRAVSWDAEGRAECPACGRRVLLRKPNLLRVHAVAESTQPDLFEEVGA